MKYQIIVCDPPWHFSDGLKQMKSPTKRSAQSQYSTLTVDEIRALDVPSVVDDDWCVLALWVPSSFLQHGLDVMNHWNFAFKQTFVWVKLKKNYALEKDLNNATRIGMGRLFRASHEIALIGVHGKHVYENLADHSQRSILFDLNSGHSVKPSGLHVRLEKMFPTANRLEMFARAQVQNWTCVGDAIDGKDIKLSLQELAVK